MKIMLGGGCLASFFAATTATESRAKSSRDFIFDFDMGTTDIVACANLEREMSPDTLLEQARDDVAANGHVWQCGAE